MNVFDFKKRGKPNRLAEQLLAKAKESEPTITKDLKAAAESNNAQLVGLGNKFKSKDSLVRKLVDESIRRNIPIEKIARRNNDTLRYTFLLDEEDYGKSFLNTLIELRKSGYDIPNKRIWNAWNLKDLETDIGYRGINITVISSQKQKFELQFHTKDSFRLKTKTHNLYEELRNPKTSEAGKIEITKKMLELAEKIKRPKGI